MEKAALIIQTENHMSIGHRLMLRSEDQFNAGDFFQVSEKVWGEVAHFLKAHAIFLSISHSSHYDLRHAANQLVSETGIDRIRELFSICECIHANYYEAWMSEGGLEASIGNVKELISLLEEIPTPSLFESSSNQSNREIQFFIRRDGNI